MATYLDVLVELLTDPDARAGYEKDPAGWLRAKSAGFLCGEDVVAGAPILAEWVPALAPALEALGAVDPGPAEGESELDAAVRVIAVICDAAPLDDEVDDEAGHEEDTSAPVG